jgi:hypothetical protein
MLIEAEASMKAGRNFNDAMIDSFLNEHVQNVWELGDEIRMRMLSGIGSAFDLAINNPAGMVALVEAVEVYEKASESFEKKKLEATVEDSGKLRFTNMRAAALEQLYQDFELRGVEMFRGVHESVSFVLDDSGICLRAMNNMWTNLSFRAIRPQTLRRKRTQAMPSLLQFSKLPRSLSQRLTLSNIKCLPASRHIGTSKHFGVLA